MGKKPWGLSRARNRDQVPESPKRQKSLGYPLGIYLLSTLVSKMSLLYLGFILVAGPRCIWLLGVKTFRCSERCLCIADCREHRNQCFSGRRRLPVKRTDSIRSDSSVSQKMSGLLSHPIPFSNNNTHRTSQLCGKRPSLLY